MNPTNDISLLNREYNITEYIINNFEKFSYIKNVHLAIKDLENLKEALI